MDTQIKIQRPEITVTSDGGDRFTYTVRSYNDLYTRTAYGTDRKAVTVASKKFGKLFDEEALRVENGPKEDRYFIMRQFEDNGFFTRKKALRVDVTGI